MAFFKLIYVLGIVFLSIKLSEYFLDSFSKGSVNRRRVFETVLGVIFSWVFLFWSFLLGILP